MKPIYPDAKNYPGESDLDDDWANDVAVSGENVYAAGGQWVDQGGTADSDCLTLAI